MASRVFGVVRDMAMAAFIPMASRDAFLVAFKLPNMLRELIGEGALNAAFVPVYSERLEEESDADFRRLVGAAMSIMIVVLGTVTVVGIFAAPWLLERLNALRGVTGAPPLSPVEIERMATLARWTFPYLFFIGLAVFAMGPLFVRNHYLTPSWFPVLLNVSLIAFCLMSGYFEEPAYALVVGVWVGGAAQVLVQYSALGRVTGVWRPNLALSHPGIKRIAFLMIPVIFGQAAGEVNKLVDTLFAAQIGNGAVTALYYANRLVQLPLSVFGLAIAAAVLPAVSSSAQRAAVQEVRETLLQGLRLVAFLVVPAMFGLIVLREPLVRLLFQWGEFSAADTERTASALAIYGAGLLSFAGVRVTVTGFYAYQDTRRPVIIASASMLLNIVLNIALVGPLGYKGLALATTIAFTVNFIALYGLWSRRHARLWDSAFLTALLKMVVAAGLMAAASFGTAYWLMGALGVESVTARITAAVIPVALGATIYAAVTHFLGVPELRRITGLLKRG
jgi:putative peptidoglycan lipid II flippase